MSVTLRERLPYLGRRLGASRNAPAQIPITAAAEARADLLMVIISPGHWSVFDRNTPNTDWLGEIREEGDSYIASHGDGGCEYRFLEFGEALSYFMEYGFALSVGISNA